MPRLIAVDLGSHAVKISTWRVQGRDVTFEERHAMTVPQDGGLPKLEHRLEALDALLDANPKLAAGPTERVALALPGGLATHHRLILPFTDAVQVEKTLCFALEAEVPFDLDEMVMASRTLEVTTQSELLTAVVREDKLGEWIAALAERQLDPECVFVDSELLGHWAEGAVTGENGGVVVVDVGHTHTAVAVVVDGQVKFCRTVSVGGHAFTRAIQRALGCEWAEAEARKHGTWVDVGDDGEVTDPGVRSSSGYAQLSDPARKAMDGAIGLLLAELRSTLLRAEDSLRAVGLHCRRSRRFRTACSQRRRRGASRPLDLGLHRGHAGGRSKRQPRHRPAYRRPRLSRRHRHVAAGRDVRFRLHRCFCCGVPDNVRLAVPRPGFRAG